MIADRFPTDTKPTEPQNPPSERRNQVTIGGMAVVNPLIHTEFANTRVWSLLNDVLGTLARRGRVSVAYKKQRGTRGTVTVECESEEAAGQLRDVVNAVRNSPATREPEILKDIGEASVTQSNTVTFQVTGHVTTQVFERLARESVPPPAPGTAGVRRR